MKAYHIYSKDSGADYGIFEAESEIEALAEMHTAAGHPCYVTAGEIVFKADSNLDVDGGDMCGQIDDWDAIEVD
jgi:hypothetical protein